MVGHVVTAIDVRGGFYHVPAVPAAPAPPLAGWALPVGLRSRRLRILV